MEIIQSNGNNKSFILLGSSCIHFFSRKRDNEHFLFSFVEGRIFQFLQITYLSKMHFKMHFLLQRFFQLRNFQKQCSWRFFFNVVPSGFFFLKASTVTHKLLSASSPWEAASSPFTVTPFILSSSQRTSKRQSQLSAEVS